MPELTNNPDQHLLPLDVPDWLARAVAPWRISSAALWRAGVMLDLRSDRARIPVLVESPIAGPLAMSLLDPRVSAKAGATFVRALNGRLQHVAPLRSWLQRLRSVAEMLDSNTPAQPIIEAWRAWPVREANPVRQVAALPEELQAAAASLPRAVRAALVLHRFARAELLEALTQWEALGPAGDDPSFTELHLDALALGLLGRRDEATACLGRAQTRSHNADTDLAIARAYEALDQREAAVAAHERVLARRGGDWDRLRLARARGDFSPGEPLPRPDPGGSVDEQVSFVRELVKILEAASRYDDALAAIGELLDRLGERAPIDLAVRAAELHLWRGEAASARARLAAVSEAERDQRARVVLGAVAILERRPSEGLTILDAIEAEGAPLERLLWKAEAHLALGQFSAADESVDRHILLENSLVAYLLKVLVMLELEPHSVEESFDSRTFFDALLVDVLPTLRSPEAIAEARLDPRSLTVLFRGILDEMAGNRSSKPTWCRRDPDGAPRLEPVALRPPSREAAVSSLVRIRTSTPEQVLASFDAVVAQYPHSPHPCTYRGELLIWLGRYEQALQSFDESDARAPARWSFVGRAAVHDLLGQAELADRWTREGIAEFGELETATTHVYRGERLRKLGDWVAARRDLETAVAYKTRRIGARINLALVYRALGHMDLWNEQIARLRADAPGFLWEAGARAGRPIDDETLLAALELMVGNRSSFLHTMIDRKGQFRVVPEPGRFVAHARLSLALARDELGRMIVKTLPER